MIAIAANPPTITVKARDDERVVVEREINYYIPANNSSTSNSQNQYKQLNRGTTSLN